MHSVLVVDGHSVIHAWDELRDLHRTRGAAARDELVRRLGFLHDSSDWHVVLVFDGRNPVVGEDHVPGGLQVFYSDAGRSADHLIERLAVKYAGTCRLTVATDDNLVRQACMASGGDAISTHGLRLLLEHEAKAFRRTHRGRLRTE